MGEAQGEEEYSVDGASDMDSEGHECDEESDEEGTEDAGEDEYSDKDENLSDYWTSWKDGSSIASRC
jgi:hypothetical protein